ncbi:hypothetical protein MK489_12170 [Myxococcota bacterium]|nr:hypothetical protein [Myxococcota bacterium]
MYRKFLNARSPLRLLEAGLHGGLGPGNLGVVVAGRGVGKTSFLVGVALDELLRSGTVLHVSMEETVAHVRAYYDTIFEDLASTTHLEDEARVHREIDRLRRIRVYPRQALTPDKLRDAIKMEREAGSVPALVVVEGLDLETLQAEELQDMKDLAEELAAEIWFSYSSLDERIEGVPATVQRFDPLVSVVVSLEPQGDVVALRALKDHDNPDLSALHVSLDPRTLLLVRA